MGLKNIPRLKAAFMKRNAKETTTAEYKLF